MPSTCRRRSITSLERLMVHSAAIVGGGRAVGQHYTARPGAMTRRGRSEPSRPSDHQADKMRGLIREESARVVKPPAELLPTVTLTGSQVRAILIATVLVLPGSVALLRGGVAAARLKAWRLPIAATLAAGFRMRR